MGDVVVIAAADDEADEDAEPPLALLQAIWQTGKGVMLLHKGCALRHQQCTHMPGCTVYPTQ